ncbi:hypothetical protein GF359_00325 [candidate division WOR-3 bacterium]|uniref:STAS/SEC14 domain-containing protein n=1 Tax=candidate division WOR-3 bacterium TaxID=2052148 RepID=A0A9D5K7C1_UNCW3|nr:hypothetical protein [candidate division WOR-3 bacterium]MBD3363638.1 hypothetical protein [candidate division WOR-3 bacterium]
MSKKIFTKPYKVNFNTDTEILHVDILHLDTEDEVHTMWAEIKQAFADKDERRTLVNLSKSKQKKMSGAARKAFREYEDYLNTLDRTAFVISNPVVRMLVKATVAGLNRKEEDILIFKTEEQALAWLEKTNNEA